MELPEITILAKQMAKEVVGKQITNVEVTNPKCLNQPLKEFQETVIGSAITSVESRGKWLHIGLDSENVLLFSPGMGADIIHFKQGAELPEKYQIKFSLSDRAGFTVRVWWFCYLHLVSMQSLGEHKLTSRLGLTPLDDRFTLEYFKQLIKSKGGGIKNLILDQKNIAGIGNVYAQDILFKAGLHPKRKVKSLTGEEIEKLYRSIRSSLDESISLGGLAYEKDFYGNKGRFGPKQFKVAYKAGQPCPICKTIVEKIKTGSTSSCICPKCQQLSS